MSDDWMKPEAEESREKPEAEESGWNQATRLEGRLRARAASQPGLKAPQRQNLRRIANNLATARARFGEKLPGMQFPSLNPKGVQQRSRPPAQGSREGINSSSQGPDLANQSPMRGNSSPAPAPAPPKARKAV